MSDWKYAQEHASEGLAQLHFFSMKKQQGEGSIELRITVREFATPQSSDMRFYAEADRELNQKTVPVKPFGWSSTLLGALAECMRNIRRFEFEGPEQK